MPKLRVAIVPAFVAALGASSAVRSAAAFERQWHAGAGLGVARVGSDGSLTVPTIGVHGAYGLTDAFNAVVEIAASRENVIGDAMPRTAEARARPQRTTVVGAGAGAAYTLDVLSWVPYAGAIVGAWYLDAKSRSIAPGYQFLAGIDWQVRRNVAVGAQFRIGQIFAPPAGKSAFSALGDLDSVPYACAFARVEYLWGW